MRSAATCFGFSQPSSVSYYMCVAKVIIIMTWCSCDPCIIV